MGTAPLCRSSNCKKCGAIISYWADYCGEDYDDRSTDGKCINLGRRKRMMQKSVHLTQSTSKGGG